MLYCHVRDIAKAIILILEANGDSFAGPDVFNVGGDENNYTKAMIVEEILNRSRKIPFCGQRIGHEELQGFIASA